MLQTLQPQNNDLQQVTRLQSSFRPRNHAKTKRKISRGKTTGMRESPGRNLVDTRSSSAYAESLLAELQVPREKDFP